MKEYENTSEEVADAVNEPAIAYEVAQPRVYPAAEREFKIPRDENGKPIGHTLAEFSAELDRKLSELYGVDFGKVTRLINSGELNSDDVTDELLSRPEFQYC